MKTRLFILTSALALLLLLSACGGRSLDPKTQALAEACDAVCMGRVEKWEFVPYPEGTDLDLYCVQRADEDWHSREVPPHGKPERILFPDVIPGLAHWDS